MRLTAFENRRDDAGRLREGQHDLHHQTLIGFKRLMELATGAGVVLSVLLIGHPKLRNDLRRPQMEQIGYRTTTLSSRACPAAAASSSAGC